MNDKNYELLYQQLGRLLQTPPDMSTYPAVRRPEVLQWVGRASVLVGEANATAYDLVSLTHAVDRLRSHQWQGAVTEIFAIIHRAHAKCELQLPPGSGGSFIPVGNAFDAYVALSKIIQSATSDVLIVDPYLDESALTEFGLTVPDGVPLRLMADEATYKASLVPAEIVRADDTADLKIAAYEQIWAGAKTVI